MRFTTPSIKPALLCTLLCLSPTAALPRHALTRTHTCTNHLLNPSFESHSLNPWLPIVQSAWSTRGVFSSPFTHAGTHHYYAHAVSTVESSLTLSQTGIFVPAVAGGERAVDCFAWVAGQRSEGVTAVEVFLDGVSCGRGELGAGDKKEWRRIGSRVGLGGGGGASEVGSTIAIVATSKAAGDDGWEIWVDDVGVVSC